MPGGRVACSAAGTSLLLHLTFLVKNGRHGCTLCRLIPSKIGTTTGRLSALAGYLDNDAAVTRLLQMPDDVLLLDYLLQLLVPIQFGCRTLTAQGHLLRALWRGHFQIYIGARFESLVAGAAPIFRGQAGSSLGVGGQVVSDGAGRVARRELPVHGRGVVDVRSVGSRLDIFPSLVRLLLLSLVLVSHFL